MKSNSKGLRKYGDKNTERKRKVAGFLSIALRKYSVRDSFVNIFNHLNLTKEEKFRSKGYDQLINVHLNENS